MANLNKTAAEINNFLDGNPDATARVALKTNLGIDNLNAILKSAIIEVVTASSVTTGKTLNSSGELINAVTSGGNVKEYNIDDLYDYYANGYNPAISGGNLLLAYYNNEGVFISGVSVINSSPVLAYKMVVPSNAVTVKIFGNDAGNNGLTKCSKVFSLKDELLDVLTPQIKNIQLTKKATDTLRFCFFGSSWGMNTWWYLNKMLSDVGINAELCCFYTGSATFEDWNNNFLNNTSVNCWTSVNGADWTATAANFKDKISEGWDIIGFQQGARASRNYDGVYGWYQQWQPQLNKLVSNIKRFSPKSILLFNSHFTPAFDNVSDMLPYAATVDGQELWQKDSYYFVNRFASISGIDIIIPSGSALWAIRRNAELNNASDLAADKLHPDNGLPMWGICAALFQTFAPQMFDKDISEVDWLPTTETQKATVSGSSFVAISEAQRETIKDIVKLAHSDRFGFPEL